MAEIVLVHGRHLGGWCWRRVRGRLASMGHEVHTPTLVGCGALLHRMRPDLTLASYVDDLEQTIRHEGLARVVLVGHDRASLLVEAVVARIPERIAQVILVDGWIGTGRQSFLELCRPEEAAAVLRRAGPGKDGWLVRPPPIAFYQLASVEDRAWVEPRLTPESRSILEEPIDGSAGQAVDVPRVYIACQGHRDSSLDRARQQAEQRGDQIARLAAGHYPMLSMPRLLADLLHSSLEV